MVFGNYPFVTFDVYVYICKYIIYLPDIGSVKMTKGNSLRLNIVN